MGALFPTASRASTAAGALVTFGRVRRRGLRSLALQACSCKILEIQRLVAVLRHARGMVLDRMQMILLSFSPLVQAGRGTGTAATATVAYGVLRVITCEHLCNVLTIGLFGENGSFTVDYLPGLC